MVEVLDSRLALEFDPIQRRRWIAGRETILHCHHYNSRIQSTIESAKAIDGKGIFVSTAEAVFAQQLAEAFESQESERERWQFASDLYSHLGFGRLDLSLVSEGMVLAPSSHFAEGWLAAFPARQEPVCSLTEGFLQGACAAITGEPVEVREIACRIHGAESCVFELHPRQEPLCSYEKFAVPEPPVAHTPGYLQSGRVDEEAIVNALAQMPILGDSEGLIPAFNVYLACMPADFYNLVTIRFLEAMDRKHLGDVGRMQLVHNAELCGLNTFRGIRDSAEWDSLIAPMVNSLDDELQGIVAVSNGLGWGNWHVTELESSRSLKLQTCNGYESYGFRQLRGGSEAPTCVMLTGVAAGIFELVYGAGPIEERFGWCESQETQCMSAGADVCEFAVEVM